MTVLLTAALVAGMGLTAFAADDPATYSITVNNVEPGHNMYAYQIFAGDVYTDPETGKKMLINIEWGNGITTNGRNALYTHYGLDGSAGKEKTAAKVAEALASYNPDDWNPAAATIDDARAIDFAGAIPNNGYNTTATGRKLLEYDEENPGTVSASGLAPGYYIIYDNWKNGSVSSNNFALSRRIVQVLGEDVIIYNKADKPTVDKKIVVGEQELKTTSASIGETVTFKLSSSVPNCTGYTTYIMTFHDTLSKGLTYTDNLVLKIGETTISPDDYTVTVGEYSTTNGTKIDIEIKIKNKDDEDQKYTFGDAVTVTYTAKLNESGAPSGGWSDNPNKVYLEYSNDPNSEDTGRTNEVEVNVTTGGFQIVKTKNVDTGYAWLDGAEFRLYRDEACTDEVKMYRNGYTPNPPGGYYWTMGPVYMPRPEEYEGEGETIPAGTPVLTGLKGGTYWLKEVKAPAGYNLVPVKEVNVSANYCSRAQSIENRRVYENVKGNDGTEYHYGDRIPWWNDYVSSAKDPGKEGRRKYATDGWYSNGGFHVINESGSVLPDTGGIGTTLFYVIGAVLVIGAGVVLVTRKRTDSVR